MRRRYFELLDDMTIPGRWALGSPTDAQGRELDDPWSLMDGRPLPGLGRLKLPVATPGRALDFTRGIRPVNAVAEQLEERTDAVLGDVLWP